MNYSSQKHTNWTGGLLSAVMLGMAAWPMALGAGVVLLRGTSRDTTELALPEGRMVSEGTIAHFPELRGLFETVRGRDAHVRRMLSLHHEFPPLTPRRWLYCDEEIRHLLLARRTTARMLRCAAYRKELRAKGALKQANLVLDHYGLPVTERILHIEGLEKQYVAAERVLIALNSRGLDGLTDTLSHAENWLTDLPAELRNTIATTLKRRRIEISSTESELSGRIVRSVTAHRNSVLRKLTLIESSGALEAKQQKELCEQTLALKDTVDRELKDWDHSSFVLRDAHNRCRNLYLEQAERTQTALATDQTVYATCHGLWAPVICLLIRPDLDDVYFDCLGQLHAMPPPSHGPAETARASVTHRLNAALQDFLRRQKKLAEFSAAIQEQTAAGERRARRTLRAVDACCTLVQTRLRSVSVDYVALAGDIRRIPDLPRDLADFMTRGLYSVSEMDAEDATAVASALESALLELREDQAMVNERAERAMRNAEEPALKCIEVFTRPLGDQIELCISRNASPSHDLPKERK